MYNQNINIYMFIRMFGSKTTWSIAKKIFAYHYYSQKLLQYNNNSKIGSPSSSLLAPLTLIPSTSLALQEKNKKFKCILTLIPLHQKYSSRQKAHTPLNLYHILVFCLIYHISIKIHGTALTDCRPISVDGRFLSYLPNI